jgi:hypothetical protein
MARHDEATTISETRAAQGRTDRGASYTCMDGIGIPHSAQMGAASGNKGPWFAP